MGKLQKLKQINVKVPDVSNVIKVRAKPDRFAIWIAKSVVFILSPGRYRHLLSPKVLETQLAFIKGVTDTEGWRSKCRECGYRTRLEKLEEKLFPGLMTHF